MPRTRQIRWMNTGLEGKVGGVKGWDWDEGNWLAAGCIGQNVSDKRLAKRL